MNRLLLILGGMRVGDTFHLIPYFEKMKEWEITWLTGTYEEEAAHFLADAYPNIVRVISHPDGVPGCLRDREAFKTARLLQYADELPKYDLIESDICISFDAGPLSYQLKDTYLDSLDISKRTGDYVVYHLDTISDWKRHSQVRDLLVDYKSISLGRSGDFILPNSQDCRGLGLTRVAELIAQARLFVGIHSAMTCLTFYINKPAIVIHPMEGLMKFGDFRPEMEDLIMPTTEQVREAILRKLEAAC